MKTAAEWDQEIIKITMKIHQEFPELSKYLQEMPVKFSENNNKGIDTKNLEAYYHSLEELLGGYAKTHVGIKVKNDKKTNNIQP